MADIPDIEQVIQFGVPPSLTVWIQRAGRAGRSENINARAILLVEKSMFERQRKRRKGVPKDNENQLPDNLGSDSDDQSDDDDEGNVVVDQGPLAGIEGNDYIFQWRKKCEDALRNWIETELCRRDAADTYFANPPNRQSTSYFESRSQCQFSV